MANVGIGQSEREPSLARSGRKGKGTVELIPRRLWTTALRAGTARAPSKTLIPFLPFYCQLQQLA
jgi:hypothetical protein